MHWRIIPWLTESAIVFLDSFLDDTKCVLEFGAGGSTIWMVPRCKELVTVEHDAEWLDRVSPHIVAGNWTSMLCPKPYATVCDGFDDNSFDLVLVDGRDRVLCTEASIRLIKPGGILMLDNSERGGYDAVGTTLCREWNVVTSTQRQKDSEGFVYENWSTSWWMKPLELQA